MKTIDRLNASDRRRLTAPALRIFQNLARQWSLTDNEQMQLMGVQSMSTIRRWRQGKVIMLRRHTFERLSLLLGVFKALDELFGPGRLADEWIRIPNSAALFGGSSALEYVLSGGVEELYALRRYLDAALHG